MTYVWAKLKRAAVLWPVKVIYAGDTSLTVFVKADNAE